MLCLQKGMNPLCNSPRRQICSKTITFPRIIYINDRATFYNVAAHTDALSTGSGVLPDGYCNRRITAIPLSDATEDMCIGWLKKKDSPLSAKAAEFIEILEKSYSFIKQKDVALHKKQRPFFCIKKELLEYSLVGFFKF